MEITIAFEMLFFAFAYMILTIKASYPQERQFFSKCILFSLLKIKIRISSKTSYQVSYGIQFWETQVNNKKIIQMFLSTSREATFEKNALSHLSLVFFFLTLNIIKANKHKLLQIYVFRQHTMAQYIFHRNRMIS